MKILYIHPDLIAAGGADRVIINKANYFAEECGFDVTIIVECQYGKSPFFKISEKVKLINLNIPFAEQYKHSFFVRGYIYFKLMKLYRKKLVDIVDEIKPDYIITTLGRSIDFLTGIKDNSIKIGEAHVPKKFVRNFHQLEQKGFLFKLTAKIWTWKLERSIRKLSDFVVLTTDDQKNWKKIRNTTVIPNPLPFYPTTISLCETKNIISVGRLCEEKGYDRLVEAWKIAYKKHPDWTVTIYGAGPDKNKLTEQINESGLSECFLLRDPVLNIVDKYINSSIFVLSSRFEGFGMVLIEAMSCGLPVVSFDCPSGPSGIISDRQDGFLVENGNINLLAEKICFLIENENIRKDMGEKARENVKQYSSDIIMQKWLNLFESLKSKKRDK